MEKKMRGSWRTLLDVRKSKAELVEHVGNEHPEIVVKKPKKKSGAQFESVWESLPAHYRGKRNAHVPKHHDATKVPFSVKYNLLLCKEMKLLCRRKLVFLIQTLLPILIIIVVNFRTLFLARKMDATAFTPFVLSPVEMKECDGTILFYPSFDKSTVIATLAKKLNAEVTTSNLRFRELKNAAKIGKPVGRSCGTVHFTNPEILDTHDKAGSLPFKIKYQLRLRAVQRSTTNSAQSATEPSQWATDRAYPKELVVGPRNVYDNEGGSPGYSAEGFLYLQRRIDKLLIQMVYKQVHPKLNEYKSDYYFQLSRFPFPSFESTNRAYLIEHELPLFMLLVYLVQIFMGTYLAVKERETGAKGFLRSYGIAYYLQWLPFIIKIMVHYTFVNIAIAFLLCTRWYKDGSNHIAIIEQSSPTLIFCLLQFVTFNTCAICCLISVFFLNATNAAYTAGIYWIFLNLPLIYFDLRNFVFNSIVFRYVSSLFAQIAIRSSLQFIAIAETNIGGAHWKDLFREEVDLGQIMAMLFTGGVVNIVLAIYIENIFPASSNRDTLRLPKFYFLRAWFWKGQLPPDNRDAPEDVNDGTILPEFFEPDPTNLKLELQVKSLSKCYPGDVGIFNITMGFFEGEITVVLGPVGSGKSTLYRLIAGIVSPTRGTILVNNINVRTESRYIKYNLGTCPADTFLYDYLSVEEHISLYAQLKGFESMADASDESDVLINALKLKSVRTHMASTLNVSQKRLVHIAIAFCAGSKVVVLDEPTAKIDTSSKRIVWAFLQKEKRLRTIVVLTKCTEETNFIADRVAIMSGGELQCRGSLTFLKAKYGGGYHLKIFKGSRFKYHDVTSLVKKEVPPAFVDNEVDEFISYFLPGEYAPYFPILFKKLETRTTSYDINDLTIQYVTLDEVFKKVCRSNESDLKIEFKRRHTLEEIEKQTDEPDLAVPVPKECTLLYYCYQFVFLLKKHVKVTWCHKWGLLVLMVVALYLTYSVAVIIQGKPFDKNFPALAVSSLDELKPFIKAKIFIQCEEQYNGNNFCDLVRQVASRYAEVQIATERELTSRIEDLILDSYRKKRTVSQSELIMAVQTSHGTSRGISTRLTILFNNQPLHTSPVAVNLAANLMMMDALTSAPTSKPTGYSIDTDNFPLEYETVQLLGLAVNYWSSGFFLGLTITYAMTCFMPILIVFPIRGKYFKHIQLICGANVFLYWLAKVCWDYVIYSVLVSLMIVILYLTKTFEVSEGGINKITQDIHFRKLNTIFHLYGFATIGVINCMIRLFKRSGVNGYFYTGLIFFLTGPFALTCILLATEQYRKSTNGSDAVKIILELLTIFPNCALGLGIFNIYTRYRFDTECTEDERKSVCPSEPRHGCCVQDPFFHYEYGYGIGENLAVLAVIGVFTHSLTIFMDTDVARRIKLHFKYTRLSFCCFDKKKRIHVVNEDPLEEIDFGDNDITSTDDDDKYEIILKDILQQTEQGVILLDIPKLRLKKQECTCCFGVDGSGKATLLQILAGYIIPDMGDVTINKKSLLRNYSQYLKRISYSPDHETLLPELTGKETLNLCAILSQVPKSKMKSVVTDLCLKLNLLNDLENKVKDFSPGTLKKLAIAIAIINNPAILIFEEPLRDVDPASRIQIIRALAELKKTSSILISTSDMELCESLCDRVVVLVNGRIRCYGSPNYLRLTYCEANTITAKLIPDSPHNYLPGNKVQLGWDYDREDADESNEADFADNIQPSKSSISFSTSLHTKSELEPVKIGAKSATNIAGFAPSKDKVRFYQRSEGAAASSSDIRISMPKDGRVLPSPALSLMLPGNDVAKSVSQTSLKKGDGSGFKPRKSLFGKNNKISPEFRESSAGMSMFRGSSHAIHGGHRMSIFNMFSLRNQPKYEYHSSSSSSDTFTSTTTMEHWQVELIPIINFIETQFPEAELINIYPCFIQYLLKNEVRLSEIFEKMTVAKKYLDLEYYTTGKMTLEQFFLHYIEGQTYQEKEAR